MSIYHYKLDNYIALKKTYFMDWFINKLHHFNPFVDMKGIWYVCSFIPYEFLTSWFTIKSFALRVIITWCSVSLNTHFITSYCHEIQWKLACIMQSLVTTPLLLRTSFFVCLTLIFNFWQHDRLLVCIANITLILLCTW